jgi:hypothetical protein
VLNLEFLNQKELMVEYWVSCWDSRDGDHEILCSSSIASIAEILSMYHEQNCHLGMFSHPDRYIRVFRWDGVEVFHDYSQSNDGNDQYGMTTSAL